VSKRGGDSNRSPVAQFAVVQKALANSPLYAICIQHMTPLAAKKSAALSRASSRQWVLKPQDLAVALKLVTLMRSWLPYAALGEAMRLSRFEAHAAIQRLGAAGLVVEVEGPPQVVSAALRSFVIFGARYAYPPVRGGVTIGFPTAQALSSVRSLISASREQVTVWPHPAGKVRGQSLLPLYESLPLAAADSPAFHELLALFDLLRIGQARERGIAQKLLEARLS
jgi:hypothetical protein